MVSERFRELTRTLIQDSKARPTARVGRHSRHRNSRQRFALETRRSAAASSIPAALGSPKSRKCRRYHGRH